MTEQDRALLERRNIGYRTFKNIRGTAPYFEHAKSRLFAFLRQKGRGEYFHYSQIIYLGKVSFFGALWKSIVIL